MVNIKKTLQGFVKTLKKLSIIVLLGWIFMLIFTHKLSIFISCFHSVSHSRVERAKPVESKPYTL